VDVIHTDAGLYGAPVTSGTVDFWPNGGRTLQPGCPPRNFRPLTDNDLCSHRRSWRFWAESLTAPPGTAFPAVKADDYTDFTRGRVDRSQIAMMGIECATNLSGHYYLQTNAQLPFARGINGTVYDPSTYSVAIPTDSGDSQSSVETTKALAI